MDPRTLTDDALLARLGQGLEHRRLRQDRTQAQLAREAGVSKRTVERLEAGGSAQLTSLVRVLRALDLLDRFDALVPDHEPGPLEQLRRADRERRRASGSTGGDRDDDGDWSWGDAASHTDSEPNSEDL